MTDPITRLNAALEGRYTLLRKLGEGGMATVYLAEDHRHERNVALKVLKPELAAVVGGERFLAEIKTTANLKHPHILPLFDSGEADSFLFYVMPYVEGETLREQIDRERQLPVDEAVRIAVAVANALQHAHDRGVVHRDIKPGNILMQDGQPVVGDFGIALAVGAAGGTRLTETGLSVGTPYYMSPEQATGDQVVGPRSDTYALAAVLYEMLTGDPPYGGSTAQAVLGKILQGDPVSATQARKSIPANVDAAIRKALERIPADRFAEAQEFAKALQDAGFTHGAAPSTAAGGGAWKTATVVLGATTLLFGGIAAVTATRPEEPRPVLRYSMIVPDELPLLGQFGGQMALSEDGASMVYAAAGEGSIALYLLERDRLEARRLDGTEGAWQPFFSPDGSRVGFITGNRELKVVSLGGEPPLTVVDSGTVRGGGTWGPDGYIYFTQGSSNAATVFGLGRVPGAGGLVETVTTLDTANAEVIHHFPEALPNGRGVLFTLSRERLYDPETMEIGVVDLETGEHRPLLQGMVARWSPTGHILFVRDDGALLAAPFDDEELVLTGPAVPILDQIALEAFGGNQVAPSSVEIDISASGTLVYTAGTNSVFGGQWTPVWVDRDGNTEIIDPEMQRGDLHFPSLSPDGTRLALDVAAPGEIQIWSKQLPRGPMSKLTFQGALNSRAAWSSDGSSVIFVSDRNEQTADIYSRRADGSGSPELVLDIDQIIDEVTYSPDGEWLVYRSAEDVYAVNVREGGEPVPLLTDEGWQGTPQISPNGRWIAYASNESGQGEVYVRPFPNVDDARWLISVNGGFNPRWAHSGAEIFYIGEDGASMMVVPVTEGTTFVSGQPTALFPLTNLRWNTAASTFDVTPDDQRFVMLEGASAGGRVVVVENFARELRERLAN